MEINISELNNGLVDKIDIDITYSFSADELKKADIRKLENVIIKGYIKRDILNNLYINIMISGEMILPCSVTLKDVVYPFSCEVNGELEEIVKEIDDFDKKSENTIDIFPIIWENILMEIPMKVVSEDAKNYKAEGNGWKLITDEDDDQEINPELAKLKDLL